MNGQRDLDDAVEADEADENPEVGDVRDVLVASRFADLYSDKHGDHCNAHNYYYAIPSPDSGSHQLN